MRLQPCSRLDYNNIHWSPLLWRAQLTACLSLQKCPSITWRAPGARGSRGWGRRGSPEWLDVKAPPPPERSRTQRVAAQRVRRWVSADDEALIWWHVKSSSVAAACERKEACSSVQLNQWIIPHFQTKLACGDFVYFFPSCQPCAKKLEGGSLRVLPLPSTLQKRITEIDQQKEELKIEVSM